MSLFQSLCLLLFNDGNEFSYEHIKKATAIGKFPLNDGQTELVISTGDGC